MRKPCKNKLYFAQKFLCSGVSAKVIVSNTIYNDSNTSISVNNGFVGTCDVVLVLGSL